MDPSNKTGGAEVDAKDASESESLTTHPRSEWRDVTGDGGVMKKVLVKGSGDTPPKGANVYCHYVGTLVADGSKFDSSRDRGQQFNFKIGQGSVIKAWDEGIATMQRGEKCILRCRWDYAYGEAGSGPKIPPKADLDFEVELFDFDEYSRVSDDVSKKVIKTGTGKSWEKPDEDATCVVSYTGRLSNGQTFTNAENVTMTVNDDPSLPPGFHEGLREMIGEEVCEFKIKAPAAFGAEGVPELKVPPNETVTYQVTLHSFENPKQTWEMSTEEHFGEAEKAKESGNQAFKEGNFQRALKRYKRAVDIMDHDSDFDEKQKEQAKGLKGKVNNNMALIHLKKKEFGDCIEKSNAVLSEEVNNIKALVRRGQANMALGNYTEASRDFKTALSIDSENATVKKLIKVNKQKRKEYKERQKKLYGNMFGGKQ